MAKDLKETIYESLNAKYKGEREEARANIMIYLENPSGIGEHPDVIAAIDTQISAMANAQEKLDILQKVRTQGKRYPVE